MRVSFYVQLLFVPGVFLLKLLYPSFSINELLFAGEERMALGTYINVYLILCGPGCK